MGAKIGDYIKPKKNYGYDVIKPKLFLTMKSTIAT